MKKNGKKSVEKAEKKAEVKKDPNAPSEKQEKALKLIQKGGTTKDALIKAMGIQAAGFGGLIGNMRKKGILVEMDKEGKLSLGK